MDWFGSMLSGMLGWQNKHYKDCHCFFKRCSQTLQWSQVYMSEISTHSLNISGDLLLHWGMSKIWGTQCTCVLIDVQFYLLLGCKAVCFPKSISCFLKFVESVRIPKGTPWEHRNAVENKISLSLKWRKGMLFEFSLRDRRSTLNGKTSKEGTENDANILLVFKSLFL